MRSSGPVRTRAFALAFTRPMSCTGTGSIRSTSPDSRAATRVGSDAIGVKTISVRLCSGRSHQSWLILKTVRTPGRWLSILNGPVPLAWSETRFAEVAVTDVGCLAWFASAQRLFMMNQVSHREMSVGLGDFRTMSTV